MAVLGFLLLGMPGETGELVEEILKFEGSLPQTPAPARARSPRVAIVAGLDARDPPVGELHTALVLAGPEVVGSYLDLHQCLVAGVPLGRAARQWPGPQRHVDCCRRAASSLDLVVVSPSWKADVSQVARGMAGGGPARVASWP